ncbi:MAG TPA: hypothetical protein VGL22_12740 [Terracidiphilus sp.]|jgi:hypothetical protein
MKNVLVLRFSKQVAAALVLLVAAQMSEAEMLPVQEQQAAQQQQAPAQSNTAQDTAKPGADAPQAPEPAPQQNGQQAEPGFATRSQDPPAQNVQQPVGTAAGPYAKPSGVAGSRPSGAAIAPAKQKHVKAILIRVGLIVGGAAAVGAVVGLSKSSPSRP